MLRRRGRSRRRRRQSRGCGGFGALSPRGFLQGNPLLTYSLPRSLRKELGRYNFPRSTGCRAAGWWRRELAVARASAAAAAVTAVGGRAEICMGSPGDFLLGNPRTVGELSGWYRSHFCVEGSMRCKMQGVGGRAARGREDRRNERSADISYYRSWHLYL